MKRTVLFLFVFCAVAVPALPASFASQAGRAPTQAVETTASSTLPEACALDRAYTAARAAEASRTTREITSFLARPVGRPAAPNSASKLAVTADNIVDAEIFGTLAARGIQPAADATDEEFCRRVTLDLTGTQPAPDDLLAYVESTDPGKKTALVDALLASPAFVDRWTNWLGDLTRNTMIGGGFLRNRNAEYTYLKNAVATNKPFDRIATDYLTYTGQHDGGPSGYLARAAFQTELRQDTLDEIAAETSRTFLGTQIACISCHDGAGHLEGINLYLAGKKRKEFWQIAAFLAQTELEFVENPESDYYNIRRDASGRYDANTKNGEGMRPARKGGIQTASFKLFGKGKPKAAEDPRVAYARLVTASPQFARAFANRIFAHFFTLGLVEPLDGFDLARLDPNVQLPVGWEPQPSHPKLLADLAAFVQQSGYDMRALMKLIVTSRAYGLSSRYDETVWSESYTRFYARKLTRRLHAEEVFDAIATATGVPARFYVRGFATPFSSTMALTDPTEPSEVEGTTSSDSPYPVQGFLLAFGRGDRWVTERSNRSTVTQALNLFNDRLIADRLYAWDDTLPNRLATDLAQHRTTAVDAVKTIYLSTIARRPTVAEVNALKTRLRDRESIADLQWALLNRVDFLYNY